MIRLLILWVVDKPLCVNTLYIPVQMLPGVDIKRCSSTPSKTVAILYSSSSMCSSRLCGSFLVYLLLFMISSEDGDIHTFPSHIHFFDNVLLPSFISFFPSTHLFLCPSYMLRTNPLYFVKCFLPC